jgi:hypothetical protein
LEAQQHYIGEIRLIVDGTKVSLGHQLLIMALAYRNRCLVKEDFDLSAHCAGAQADKQPRIPMPCERAIPSPKTG